jgi:hypothetical protein
MTFKYTLAELKEAEKKIPKEKHESYFLIDVSYDKKFVVPYKQGIALMSAMEGGYYFMDNWEKPPTFRPLEGDITIRPISEEEIKAIKVAQLLQLSLSEVKKIKAPT